MANKKTIPLTDRRPVTIDPAEWPRIAYGEAYSGQYDFQAFDGVYIAVRKHADGRHLVYGEAGDWKGGGRPEREDRKAGYLLAPDVDVVAAIRDVANILEETDHIGDMAHAAERRCIGALPSEEI